MINDVLAPRTAKRGLVESPEQTTVHVIGDAADMAGQFIAKGPYYVLTAASYPDLPGGVFSGSVNLDVAHYAANTISFDNATGKILDSANLLATILTNDKIIVKGSASNDNVEFTVTTGATAGFCIVTPAPTTEAAGAYISLYKRASHANAAVIDAATGLMWSRNTSTGEKVGAASIGTLVWYDAAKIYTLHPAAADLAMIAPSTLRIVGGAGEINHYHVGDVLKMAGFATANNNLPGWVVNSVTGNGADLDIVLKILGATAPTAEAAAGSRSISLVCQSIYNYGAAANITTAPLSGYTDWRQPIDSELLSLRIMKAPTAYPSAAAFPVWGAINVWSVLSRPSMTTQAFAGAFGTGGSANIVKTAANYVELVRNV